MHFYIYVTYYLYTRAVAQWVRMLAPQAEVWVFESQPRQNIVVKKRVVTAPLLIARQ